MDNIMYNTNVEENYNSKYDYQEKDKKLKLMSFSNANENLTNINIIIQSLIASENLANSVAHDLEEENKKLKERFETLRILMKEVLKEINYIADYCYWCGQIVDSHEEDCFVYRTENFLKGNK